MNSFEQLGLSASTLKALGELGFTKPSPIQDQAIPQLLQNAPDFIGLAQTGTGKTAAFGIPLIERIDPDDKSVQALILAPTRELGQQIAEQLALFSKYADHINVLPVYGGAAISQQIKALRKPQQIIIATPGRLIDLMERKALKLDQLQILVLDEADEMLNMGFKDELDRILSYTPQDKMTWLFSATMPPAIKKIVNTYMHEPIEVQVSTRNEVNRDIDHQYIVTRPGDKGEALLRFLDLYPDMRGLVFCRTKRDTQALAEELLQKNYRADALHGDLSQAQRDRVMKRFKEHQLQVLVATDVAARGIDVNDLTHVMHFNLPDDGAYYTHRSGRTARAGKKGISMAFISSREHGRLRGLEKALGINFTKAEVPAANDIAYQRMENWAGEVQNQELKGNFDRDLFEKIDLKLIELTREELLAKIISRELSRMNLSQARDLNDKRPPSKGGNKSQGNYKHRGPKKKYGGSGPKGKNPKSFKKRFRK